MSLTLTRNNNSNLNLSASLSIFTLSFLTPEERAKCSRVSTGWRIISNDNRVWNPIYAQLNNVGLFFREGPQANLKAQVCMVISTQKNRWNEARRLLGSEEMDEAAWVRQSENYGGLDGERDNQRIRRRSQQIEGLQAVITLSAISLSSMDDAIPIQKRLEEAYDYKSVPVILIAEGYIKQKRFDEALTYIRNIQPTQLSVSQKKKLYNTLVDALRKDNQQEKVLEVMKEMQKA